MQIVLVSDTHGRNEVFAQLRERHPLANAYLHAGDSETDPINLDGFASVQGNNDYYSSHPEQVVLDLGGVRVLMVHSHQYHNANRISGLIVRARKVGAKLVLYGHTHIYSVIEVDGITLINPGSLWHNRDSTPESYALITIQDEQIDIERLNYPRIPTVR
jgi:putative phosphoesterase